MQTYEQYLLSLVETDNRYIVMTAENRAAIRGITNILGKNFIDTGITEQTMVGMAAGLALQGRVPIIHALAAFLTMRAFEFIRTDVGISGLPVKIVGSVPGFLSDANGPTHQAIEDIALMRGIPPMNIFCPSDIDDLLIGLPHVIESPSPFYIRFNNLKTVIRHNKNFEIGKAEIFSEGKDITILTYGFMLKESIITAAHLTEKGYSVGLVNLRTLKPIDADYIISLCRETACIVTIEDHFISGGLFSILSELTVNQNITAKILPIALHNRWFKPALISDVLEFERFKGELMAEDIVTQLEKDKNTKIFGINNE